MPNNRRKNVCAVCVLCVVAALQGHSLALAQCEVDKVTASAGNANAGDRFGISVDVNGDFAVVGADVGDGGGQGEANTGAAFLFRRDGLNWIELKHLVASDGFGGDDFGASVAVGAGAELVVVGSPMATGRNTTIDAGVVYVFKRYQDSFPCRGGRDCVDVGLTTCTNGVCEGLTWAIEAKLLAPDPKIADGFGNAVAISGNVVVVGESRSDAVVNPATGNGDSGAAYVFRRYENSFPCVGDNDCQRSDVGLITCDLDVDICEGVAWVLEEQLLASDAAVLEFFGTSVAVDDDRIVVGAPGFTGSGAAYVFKYDGSTWNETQKLNGSDSQILDKYGQAVALHDGFVVVTALLADNAAQNTGKAYVYRLIGDTYGDEQILTASNAASSDKFGRSASLFGDLLLVGARDTDVPGSRAGSAYLFRFDGTDWNEVNEFQGSDTAGADLFGHSVALSETYAIVGAYKHDDDGPSFDDGGADSGSAYMFAIGLGRDCNGNSVPDDCDILEGTLTDANSNGTPDECECASDSDCVGGDECSTSICNQDKLCELRVNAGFCRIRSVCYVEGDADPIDLCRECNPAVSDTTWSPEEDGTSCMDDGLFCNGSEQCFDGICSSLGDPCKESDFPFCDEALKECVFCVSDLYCDDDNECTRDSCDRTMCLNIALPTGTPCGSPATSACDRADTCDGNGQCQTNPEPDGTTCEDQLFCNGSETCVSGVCQSNGDPCGGEFAPICDEDIDGCTGCVADEACDDGLFCTGVEECVVGVCISPGNPCARTFKPNCNEKLERCFSCFDDDDCDDGNSCTTDRCEQAICVHPSSSKGEACGDSSASLCDRPDFCDGLGNCLENLLPDGTLCLDGFFCNGKESCAGGVCVAATDPCAGSNFPVCNEDVDACQVCAADSDCDDQRECTNDVCFFGQCIHPPVPGDTPCGDRRRTICDRPDYCDRFGSCLEFKSRDGSSCEDGLYCTGEDTCLDGVCEHTGNDCSDAGLFCDEQTDSCSDTRPTKVIYSNTFGTDLWRPQPTSIWIAEDIVTDALDVCRISEVSIRVNGGIPDGSGQFSVRTRLWDGCPGLSNSSIVPGTDLLHEGLNDDDAIDHDLQLLPPGEPISLPPTFWIQASFSARRAGWVVGTPTTTGYSGDLYHHPFTGCNTWFGGWPTFPHVSGYTVVRAEEPCATMFPAYRAISPTAETYVPPLGPLNRIADDLELVGGTCVLAAYEVAIRGYAGPYRMSIDLRVAPEGFAIAGTESEFEGKGEGSLEVARFTVGPETVIELPPDLWMTWQANKAATGVLNVGRTQIGQSEPTFAGTNFSGVTGWARNQLLADRDASFHISIFCRGTEPVGVCCPAHTPEMEPTCDQANPVPASECVFPDTRCGILFDCPTARWANRGRCFQGGGGGGSFRPVCGVHACCGFGTCTNRSYQDCMAITNPGESDRPCETDLDCPGDRLCQSNGVCDPERAQWISGEFCDAQSFQCPNLACADAEGDCFSNTDELPCNTNADCPSFRRCRTELDLPVCESRTACGNAACCDAVCGSGPVGEFCCEIAWDSICAAFADETCSRERADTCFDESDPRRKAYVLSSTNHTFSVDNRGANVLEDEPGFACHSVAPGKKGRGSVWYRFQATDTSARIHTCDKSTTVGPTDTLLQVMGMEDATLGACADGSPCNIVLQDCDDGFGCGWTEEVACATLSTIGCNDDTEGCGENGLNSDLCVTGLIPNESYYILLATKTDADLGPHRLTIESPCPGLPPVVQCKGIVTSEPSNCAIDARQPHAINNDDPQGLQQITLTFAPENCDPRGLVENGFRVDSLPAGASSIAILKAVELNRATIQLDRPLAPREWTCISHIATEGRTCIGALPGDVNGDGTANPSLDIPALIDCLNRPGTCAPWQENIDRAGAAAGVLDLVRLIDLFNGAGAYDSWTGASMLSPDCPSR